MRRAPSGWAALTGAVAAAMLAGCDTARDDPDPVPDPPVAEEPDDVDPGREEASPDPPDPVPAPAPEPEPEPSTRPYRELPDELTLDRELVAEAPDQVTTLAVRPGDGRLFAGDKEGRVWVVEADGDLRSEPLLDLSDQVLAGSQTSEQGLLSIAFHPQDPDRLFAYWVTAGDDDTVLAEFRLDAAGDRADPASQRTVLAVEQPFRWHNGGHVLFGPDGMLWLSLGDGGLSGDPELFAQDPTVLLGSILRIDVDGGGAEPYVIPDDNPFADGTGGAPEVWAYGLRNPWRMAFDEIEWRLYVTDVGQHVFEWVNVVDHDEGGANFGWPIVEASTCFVEHQDRCPGEGFTDPVFEYTRPEGECAIVGAHVYDGAALPYLAGHFFYTDFCAGWLRSFRYHDGEVRDERDWSEQVGPFEFPVTIAADPDGELLVSDDLGAIWRIVPA